ncbi:aspartyl-phosphate phosphatase Spo0E family protein [Paenibacillus thiaminolyticus]|uniref:aspartyl-phosphate phosphatase Spo0E family protein n=1 Tax=Paenibacillus thiaminolyticus TaxID=49283 RepID=UPI00232E2B04|nr:aspartyl-phosphate phosphatase Spo0E family protein [Paenibacillus thiaminolyticus]WCF10755.1 aspartyl-phosphate phosphatase Spo0E family protein [Paenibacillus thiaminolyticus]
MNHQNEGKGALIPFQYSYEKPGCLIEMIESTRQELIVVAIEKKCLTDETVVRLSQKLDTYLLEFQRRSCG